MPSSANSLRALRGHAALRSDRGNARASHQLLSHCGRVAGSRASEKHHLLLQKCEPPHRQRAHNRRACLTHRPAAPKRKLRTPCSSHQATQPPTRITGCYHVRPKGTQQRRPVRLLKAKQVQGQHHLSCRGGRARVEGREGRVRCVAPCAEGLLMVTWLMSHAAVLRKGCVQA